MTGLPTPRECKVLLDRITQNPEARIGGDIRAAAVALLSRLSDEALELDEKRRADLEELAATSRREADWQYSDLRDKGIQPMSLSMDIRGILRRLDGPLRRDIEMNAVAQTPQEKETN